MPCLAIETGIEEQYEQALIKAAHNNRWETRVVQHIPFSDEWENAPKNFRNRTDVWFHGSIVAAKSAARVTNWHVHAKWEWFTVRNYLMFLHAEMVNAPAIPITLKNLKKLGTPSGDLWWNWSENNVLFLRPDEADKVFNGGTISKNTFEEQLKFITFYDPPESTLCWIAQPKSIRQEARFLVVDSKLVTGSLYRVEHQSIRLEAPVTLMKEAQRILDYCLECGYNPDTSWVLDLAFVEDEWKILEVGPSSCCGLYACDLNKFIQALTPHIV